MGAVGEAGAELDMHNRGAGEWRAAETSNHDRGEVRSVSRRQVGGGGDQRSSVSFLARTPADVSSR
ncbi:MAG: hypothetical protein DHS20C21_04200 [Gemmatimonadota bacterium]|nr:MAG: hypothetical protein DHS20C21_04200 [Gemmatimonadota bacterium]